MTKPVLPPPIHDLPPEEPTQGTKIMNKLAVLSLAVVAVVIGVFLYWGAQNDDVIQLNKDPIPTRTIRDHPTAGGVVFLQTDFCKTIDRTGKLRYSFISQGREVLLPLTEDEIPKGCHEVELPVLIPKDIPPGEYKIKVSLTYDVNPLKRDVNESFYSLPVIIDPSVPTNDR